MKPSDLVHPACRRCNPRRDAWNSDVILTIPGYDAAVIWNEAQATQSNVLLTTDPIRKWYSSRLSPET
jgi:hypothetical protein